MAKQLKPELIEILKKYKLKPEEALWDCHGTWVMLHKYIEQVAQTANIQTEIKQIVDSNPSNVVVLVEGSLGDHKEWTFGEASPKNNKNAYPYSMAEKRAKDRVILKLIGLAGHVYSQEDVADEDNEKNPFEIKNPPKEIIKEVPKTPSSEEAWAKEALVSLNKVKSKKAYSDWKNNYGETYNQFRQSHPEEIRNLANEIERIRKLFTPTPTLKESA